VRDSDAVAAMRRELGRQLAARRKAAGLVQRKLGRMAGYSRTAIANAETGGAVTAGGCGRARTRR
jgi:DNA-binding XRE family transcriptional regulator